MEIHEAANIIIIFLISSGGMCSMLFSLLLLVSVKEKKRIHYLHASMFFIYGFCVLCDPFYKLGTESIAPHLLYLNYPMMYLLGPVIFFYFRNLVSDNVKFSFKHLPFLIPPVAVLLVFLPYYFQPAAQKIQLFPLHIKAYGFMQEACLVTEYGMLIWVSFCFLISFRYTWYLWNKKIPTVRTLARYLVLWIVLTAFLAYSDISGKIMLYRIGMLLTVVLTLFLTFLTFRYPYFFRLIRKEISKYKYANSRIGTLNIVALIERIEDLMEYEQIYTNEELNLHSLSEMVKISPEQLSEIINSRYNENFNAYVNRIRIDAARKLLEEAPEKSILSIAVSCGYKSKSTFNSAFKKFSGLTPTEYRAGIFKKN